MKICKQCQSPFEVTDSDREFYDRISPLFNGKKYLIPEPDICFYCREQIRLTWKNERSLYKRTCDLCKKSTMSIFSSDKPYTVYCPECWWSDKWDPMDYGMDFDFDRPFFEQLEEFVLKIPKQALHQNNNYENCEYTTSTTRNRNCYLISSAGYNEDCYYGIYMPRNKNCVDCTHVMDSEKLYECIDCDKSYHLNWCRNCKDCSDSYFLYDCHGCRNCFFSYGLRNKQYVFKNEQLSKEDYEKRISEINFSSYETTSGLKSDFQEFSKAHTRLYYEGQNNEDIYCSDHIFNSRNCSYCFDAINIEDCKFCSWFNDSHHCYDVHSFGYNTEFCYNCSQVGTSANHLLMCMNSWDSTADLIYCLACHASQNLFACAGLKRKKYCVFNKQYNKEEYESLAGKIIERMQADGQWGEFFPPSFSHFGYNETMASDFYPITRDEVIKRGWLWRDASDEIPKADRIIPAGKLPDRTSDIPDDVLNWAIECEETGRPYKLTAQELKFYRNSNLPVPHLHPDERHKKRMQSRNSHIHYERKCDKCGAAIRTTYSTDRPERVYCEECYLKEVY